MCPKNVGYLSLVFGELVKVRFQTLLVLPGQEPNAIDDDFVGQELAVADDAFGVCVVVRDDFIAHFLEGVLQAQLAHARGDEVCADLGGFVVFLSVHLSGVFEQNI